MRKLILSLFGQKIDSYGWVYISLFGDLVFLFFVVLGTSILSRVVLEKSDVFQKIFLGGGGVVVNMYGIYYFFMLNLEEMKKWELLYKKINPYFDEKETRFNGCLVDFIFIALCVSVAVYLFFPLALYVYKEDAYLNVVIFLMSAASSAMFLVLYRILYIIVRSERGE